MYLLFADLVLLVHCAFVVFVVLTVPLILLGSIWHWRWVRNRWLRILHLVGVCVVALQSWVGMICPLTTLEMWLRRQAAGEVYEGSFIAHWLQQALYWDWPGWVFILLYSVFAALVLLTWLLVPPDPPTSGWKNHETRRRM